MEYLCPRCATPGSEAGYCDACTARNDAEYVRIGALSADQLRMLRFADAGRKWSADVEQGTFPIVVLPVPEPALSATESAFFSQQLVAAAPGEGLYAMPYDQLRMLRFAPMPQLPVPAIFTERNYSRNFSQAPSVRAEQDQEREDGKS